MKKVLQSSLRLPVTLLLAALFDMTVTQAASLSSYGMGRVERYEQTGDTSIALASEDPYAFTAFAIPTSSGSVFGGFLTVPGAILPTFLDGEDALTAGEFFSAQGDLESSYPTGEYTFSVISATGMEEGKLNLGSGAFPNTPQIANFTAAQAVDPETPFVVNWNAFEGGTSGDFIQFTVMDDDNNVLFQTGWPGQPTALDGTARSATIPANRLASGKNRGVVWFLKVTERNTSAFGGAPGMAGAGKETVFSLRTGSGGDPGGEDTTPPYLVSSSPANLASNAATNTPVIFTFNEAMAPSQEIIWDGTGVNEANFSYKWSGDGQTLTCTYAGGFPANTMVIWELNPSGFLDLAGNELGGEDTIGFFRTVSGGQSSTNNPCDPDPGDDLGFGAFTVFKHFSYVQTGSAAPVLDAESPAMFYANMISPDTNPVTRATLTLPNGSTKEMEQMFNTFMVMDEFRTVEALDAAYPSGIYRVQAQRENGSATLTVTVPSSAEPPTPQMGNASGFPDFNPAADFTLTWSRFTGAGPNDHLSVTLYDRMGTIFTAPDACVPRPLEVTDTSIVVPKNTFTSTGIIDGSLTFTKFGTFDTNTVRDIVASSAVSKQTDFKLGKASTSELVLQNYVREGNGVFRFQVKAPQGSMVIVETSEDLRAWTTVSTGMASSGVLEVVDAQAATHDRRYYRARTVY
ncbi:MAG: Ig-like domain-containing protein [Verrucomicrobiia bacterium]